MVINSIKTKYKYTLYLIDTGVFFLDFNLHLHVKYGNSNNYYLVLNLIKLLVRTVIRMSNFKCK